MFDENQLVEMRWSNFHKQWYVDKGYQYTKQGDVFYVKAKDMKPSSQKHVNVICDYCGNEYTTAYKAIVKGRASGEKDCCHSCCGKKANESGRGKRIANRFAKIKSICSDKGYKLITTIDEYVDGNTIIVYECPKHGKQTTKANYFCDGSGCKKCRLEKISQSNGYTPEIVKEIIERVDGNILINPNEYKDSSTLNLKIKCRCGNVYTTSLTNYTNYNVTRCPSCSHSESKAEARIKSFFNDNGIIFEQERSFDGCRNINKMPFDFYIPSLNICIEFNGKQHYEPIEYFGGKEAFKLRKKKDKIKYDYCTENNIGLIIIPYWEESNIEEILTKELNL